jgi:hypothetical protein
LVESSIIAKVPEEITVGRRWLFLNNNAVQRFPALCRTLFVAGHHYLCPGRARRRLPHTHATFE